MTEIKNEKGEVIDREFSLNEEGEKIMRELGYTYDILKMAEQKMVECNFKTRALFSKKILCRLKNDYLRDTDCDEDKCIFQKILKKSD